MRSIPLRLSALVLALLALGAGTAFAASAPLGSAGSASGVLMLEHKAPSKAIQSKLDALLYDYDVVELPPISSRGQPALAQRGPSGLDRRVHVR